MRITKPASRYGIKAFQNGDDPRVKIFAMSGHGANEVDPGCETAGAAS